MRKPSGAVDVRIGEIPCWKDGDKVYRIMQPDGDGVLGWRVRYDGLLETVVRERGQVRVLVPGDPDRSLTWEDIVETKPW